MSLKVGEPFLGGSQEDARGEQVLQIALMGEFSLQRGETIISLETPSHQALLAYLIVHANQIHTRNKLAFLIWPDSTESQARTNLRKAIHTIRATLPNAGIYLDVNRQTLQWCPGSPSVIDVWEFEKAIAQFREAVSGTNQQTGEAGIGKTRLAEEMIDWAERQGIVEISAVCYPSEKQLAYAPVAKLLRSEQLKSSFRRLPERQLVECSRLLPELQKEYPDLTNAGSLTESWQHQHFFSALAQTVLQLRQPFLLFLDDLSCCDRDTLGNLVWDCPAFGRFLALVPGCDSGRY